jgi:hypothetical protein
MASASSSSYIPLPAPLRTSGNLAVEWKRFHGQWQIYSKAAKIDREDPDRQAAIFLACIGSEAYDIYANMEFETDDDRAKPDTLIEAFARHCVGEINEIYERYVFHRRLQEPGESFNTFVGDLRRLAKSCGYGTAEDSMIRDRIVIGIRDDATRKKLLQTRTLDLAKGIDIGRSSEAATRQLKAMTTPDELHALRQHHQESRPRHRSSSRYRRGKSRGAQELRSPSADRRGNAERLCAFCNGKHHPGKQYCKAYGATCTKCARKNHFASVCKSKQNKDACDSLTEEPLRDESLLSLHEAIDKRCFSNILVDGHPVKFLLDTGSTANVIPVSIMMSLGKRMSDLRPSRSTLHMFDRAELRTIGTVSAELTHPKTMVTIEVDFYVTETADPVLGISACRRLDIVRIVDENVCAAQETPSSSPPPPKSPPLLTSRPVPAPRSRPTPIAGRLTEAVVVQQFADLFDGRLGLLEGDVHLDVDPNIRPVQMPLRRLPVAVRDHVEAELRKMVEDGVIAPVTKPTPWVSALLVTSKHNGGYRVCIDPKFLNVALQRSTYYMPTIDDVLPKLRNAKVFSTLDAASAFWHLKLDEPSSYLTTFETPFGRYRWLRCLYGISPAPEIYQARMHAALLDLHGIHNIADDLLVTGSGDTLADAERDPRLTKHCWGRIPGIPGGVDAYAYIWL